MKIPVAIMILAAKMKRVALHLSVADGLSSRREISERRDFYFVYTEDGNFL
jgi:hypothetical protein